MAEIKIPIQFNSLEFTIDLLNRIVESGMFKDGITEDYKNGFNDFAKAAIGALEKFRPYSYDAVPVVRCKDCKYCLHVPANGSDGEFYYCKQSLLHAPEAVNCNDFCSYGENMDTGDM